MKKLLVFLYCFFASLAFAQQNVQKSIASATLNDITGNLNFPLGDTLQVKSGATLNGAGAFNFSLGTLTLADGQVAWVKVDKTGSTLADLTTRSAADLSSGTLLAARMPALTGDITTSVGAVATTLATVNANVGTFGNATASPQVTLNGKGLVTAGANVTITPAVGSITGLGTGVATALGVATNAAGGFSPIDGTATFTNKTISLGSNTLTATSAQLATALSDETGSGLVVFSTSPTFITPTLGAASATSLALTGTAGAGFVSLLTQSSAPSAPASGFVEFADSTGRRSWRRASDGFVRTWDAALTADRVYTLQDAAGTILQTTNASTGVTTTNLNSITSASSTDLTLTGNGGASVVLGNGASGIGTVKATPSVQLLLAQGANTSGAYLGSSAVNGAWLSAGAYLTGGNWTYGSTNGKVAGASYSLFTGGDLGFFGQNVGSVTAGTTFTPTYGLVLSNNGNTLVGQFTTPPTDISGAGGLKVFGNTASTSTTSGALQVVGGVGIGGAAQIGGVITSAGAITQNVSGTSQLTVHSTSGSGNQAVIELSNTAESWNIKNAGDGFQIRDGTNAFTALSISTGAATSSVVTIAGTTDSSSISTGSLQTAGGLAVTKSSWHGGQVMVGTADASAAAWGTAGIKFRSPAATFTDTSASGTVASAVFNSFAVPSITTSNSGVTITDGANVYIAGGPTASATTNLPTLTNSWGLWNAGRLRVDGTSSLNNSVSITSGSNAPLGVTSSSAGGGQLTLQNSVGGTVFYITPSGFAGTIGIGASATTPLLVTSAGITTVQNATTSTSTTTGSLINSGGFGNAGAIFGGSTLSLNTNATTNAIEVASASANAGIRITNSAVGGPYAIMDATNATLSNRFAGFMINSNSTQSWQFSMRGDANAQIYDVVNAVKMVTFTPGAVGAGFVSFNNTLDATTGGAGSLTTAGGIYAAKKIIGNSDIEAVGNFATDTAGKTLTVKSGSNALAGTVTLVGGTATISSTAIDANTVVVFSEKTAGGTPGIYQPLAAVSAGSAVVTSAATDTSTYNWIAFKVN